MRLIGEPPGMTMDNTFIAPASVPDYKALYENYDYATPFYKRDMNSPIEFNYV